MCVHVCVRGGNLALEGLVMEIKERETESRMLKTKAWPAVSLDTQSLSRNVSFPTAKSFVTSVLEWSQSNRF